MISIRAPNTGKARQVNARIAALASHYLFEPEFLQLGIRMGEP